MANYRVGQKLKVMVESIDENGKAKFKVMKESTTVHEFGTCPFCGRKAEIDYYSFWDVDAKSLFEERKINDIPMNCPECGEFSEDVLVTFKAYDRYE